MNQELGTRMRVCARQTEERLALVLQNAAVELQPLYDSMRYSIFAGGKRVRPFLVLEFARMLEGNEDTALSFAAAIEMVHTYSLIHDDLPCMDNDDYRRGSLTNHKVYGEGTAVLAGDALLTLAFETLAGVGDCVGALRAVSVLAHAAGPAEMVGGQFVDITAENKQLSFDELRGLQRRKTGALISAAAELGCIAAGVKDDRVLADCRRYAENIGCAFQIVDDILDVYGDEKELGKRTGQDSRDGKVTFLSFMTKEMAYKSAADLTDQAKQAIVAYAGNEYLVRFAEEMLIRRK